MWIWCLIIAAVVVADQITKQIVVTHLEVGESVDLIPGVFRFTYVQNEGAAFGMLSQHRWVFMVISTVAIVALFVYLWKYRPQSRFACAGLAMVVGGGIGNMIDRCYLTYVIDFLDFCAFPKVWMWVFNVADACVCVGGAMLLLWCVVELIRESRKGKEAPAKTVAEEPVDVGADSADAERNE